MDSILFWVAALAITLVAGVAKGITGFALPMIMIGGLGSFLAPDTALAMLIIPTLVANLVQSFRHGAAAVLRAMARHRRFLAIMGVVVVASAQLVALLPARAMLATLGSVVILFVVVRMAGWRPPVAAARQKRVGDVAAVAAGLMGGVSGTWGPPTLIYLMTMRTERREVMLVQGVIYSVGSVMLVAGHATSGILNAQTVPLSLAMLPAALAGIAIGQLVGDRLDQRRFEQFALALLLVAGLNLLRRGLLG